jgi:iron uptake system component EfeO
MSVPTTSRVLLAIAALVVAGCAEKSTERPRAGAAKVAIELTDDGCKPSPAQVAAGPVTFEVKNTGAGKVTEAELLRGTTIMGEKENLSPGLSGTFSLNLGGGKYQIYCPNAKTEKSDFTVTGSANGSSRNPAVKADLDRAVGGYRQFVIDEVAELVPATRRFTDAVRSRDIDRAKELYAPARYHYEQVEPVAESFGDLDPDIDARVNDVAGGEWTGFHRLEKALWRDKSLAGTAPVADKLDADVARLKTLVAKTTYQPAQLANGATELLNEVASSKITGEENRYGHTDLSDFEANVLGGRKAFDLLRPALNRIDAGLAQSITRRYEDVLDALRPYRRGDGFVDYSTVGDDKRRVLTQKVDALAEPLSQVAAKVNG